MDCHDVGGNPKPKIVHKNRFRCSQCEIFNENLKKQQQQVSLVTNATANVLPTPKLTNNNNNNNNKTIKPKDEGTRRSARTKDVQNAISTIGREVQRISHRRNTMISAGPKRIQPKVDPLRNGLNLGGVHKWTINQVHKYFKKSFPQEAIAFQENEIDGEALLLLARTDIVQEFHLKLGPAVKLYKAVLQLQQMAKPKRKAM